MQSAQQHKDQPAQRASTERDGRTVSTAATTPASERQGWNANEPKKNAHAPHSSSNKKRHSHVPPQVSAGVDDSNVETSPSSSAAETDTSTSPAKRKPALVAGLPAPTPSGTGGAAATGAGATASAGATGTGARNGKSWSLRQRVVRRGPRRGGRTGGDDDDEVHLVCSSSSDDDLVSTEGDTESDYPDTDDDGSADPQAKKGELQKLSQDSPVDEKSKAKKKRRRNKKKKEGVNHGEVGGAAAPTPPAPAPELPVTAAVVAPVPPATRADSPSQEPTPPQSVESPSSSRSKKKKRDQKRKSQSLSPATAAVATGIDVTPTTAAAIAREETPEPASGTAVGPGTAPKSFPPGHVLKDEKQDDPVTKENDAPGNSNKGRRSERRSKHTSPLAPTKQQQQQHPRSPTPDKSKGGGSSKAVEKSSVATNKASKESTSATQSKDQQSSADLHARTSASNATLPPSNNPAGQDTGGKGQQQPSTEHSPSRKPTPHHNHPLADNRPFGRPFPRGGRGGRGGFDNRGEYREFWGHDDRFRGSGPKGFDERNNFRGRFHGRGGFLPRGMSHQGLARRDLDYGPNARPNVHDSSVNDHHEKGDRSKSDRWSHDGYDQLMKMQDRAYHQQPPTDARPRSMVGKPNSRPSSTTGTASSVDSKATPAPLAEGNKSIATPTPESHKQHQQQQTNPDSIQSSEPSKQDEATKSGSGSHARSRSSTRFGEKDVKRASRLLHSALPKAATKTAEAAATKSTAGTSETKAGNIETTQAAKGSPTPPSAVAAAKPAPVAQLNKPDDSAPSPNTPAKVKQTMPQNQPPAQYSNYRPHFIPGNFAARGRGGGRGAFFPHGGRHFGPGSHHRGGFHGPHHPHVHFPGPRPHAPPPSAAHQPQVHHQPTKEAGDKKESTASSAPVASPVSVEPLAVHPESSSTDETAVPFNSSAKPVPLRTDGSSDVSESHMPSSAPPTSKESSLRTAIHASPFVPQQQAVAAAPPGNEYAFEEAEYGGSSYEQGGYFYDAQSQLQPGFVVYYPGQEIYPGVSAAGAAMPMSMPMPVYMAGPAGFGGPMYFDSNGMPIPAAPAPIPIPVSSLPPPLPPTSIAAPPGSETLGVVAPPGTGPDGTPVMSSAVAASQMMSMSMPPPPPEAFGNYYYYQPMFVPASVPPQPFPLFPQQQPLARASSDISGAAVTNSSSVAKEAAV